MMFDDYSMILSTIPTSFLFSLLLYIFEIFLLFSDLSLLAVTVLKAFVRYQSMGIA